MIAETLNIQIGKRGVLTLPKVIRERYGLEPGDMITLRDLGGSIVLTPGRSRVDDLADRVRKALDDDGQTLESMLSVLREERARYGDPD